MFDKEVIHLPTSSTSTLIVGEWTAFRRCRGMTTTTHDHVSPFTQVGPFTMSGIMMIVHHADVLVGDALRIVRNISGFDPLSCH